MSEFIALAPKPSTFLSKTVEAGAFGPTLLLSLKSFHPFLFFQFFLGLILLVRLPVTLRGKFRLLTLSYLPKSDCPLGSLARCGVTRLLNNIFR